MGKFDPAFFKSTGAPPPSIENGISKSQVDSVIVTSTILVVILTIWSGRKLVRFLRREHQIHHLITQLQQIVILERSLSTNSESTDSDMNHFSKK